MTITPIERFLHFASHIRLDHKLSKIEITENRASNDMSEVLPIVYLARHGETAWTISGQHTSFTDLTLTERGERNARRLEKRLRGASFAKVFTARCSVPGARVSWPALEVSLRSTRIWSNGTMASTRVG